MKNNTGHHFIAGLRKFAFYIRITMHVAFYYAKQLKKWNWSLIDYFRFLKRAFQLLLVFRHNKVVKVFNGYKLHLYLPSYPSKAFFYAIESKLCKTVPAPSTIVFSITKACGYKCQHCYQRNDQTQELEEAIMINVAKQMQELGVSMFDLEGGEPFLRYDRLLNLVESLDDRAEVWVNTTGFGLTEDKLLRLKSKGLFGFMVSIHSPDEQKHDDFTGVNNSFKTACETLRLCRKHNLVSAINSVLSEDEIIAGKLVDLMNLAKDLDCDYVQLIHPKPAGKWLGHIENMQNDKTLLCKIRKEHVYYNSRKTSRFPSLAAQVFEESENVLGCTAGGIDRFYLNASGELQPCEFLNISFGNVKDEGFTTAYNRMRATFPFPCCDWLCCTKANDIYQIFQNTQIKQTPLPWAITKLLVCNWEMGKETPIYRRLGIYK